VPVQRQLKQEFGFRTEHADVDSTYRHDEKTSAESLMLTGDLNVATVEWIVQYKISDPYKYLFKLRDVDQTFRLMAEASMRSVVGDHSVTELLTVGRESIAAKAKELLSELCRLYDNGISVQQLVLQDVDPPEPVKPSFNEVNQAIQERERAINEAWAEYNQEIPRARGLAEQKIEASEGYAVDRVNRAKGEAERFDALEAQYRKAPEVTRARIYLETLSTVLPAAGKKLIFDEKAKGILPLFPLGAGAAGDKDVAP
jgi:membrane protease subunit HflK